VVKELDNFSGKKKTFAVPGKNNDAVAKPGILLFASCQFFKKKNQFE
jgi:hypothetical protein